MSTQAPSASSSKDIVLRLLQQLPDEVSLHDISREIEFVAAVREGLAELDHGGRHSLEDIEAELDTWVTR